jgi:hypothetical protein
MYVNALINSLRSEATLISIFAWRAWRLLMKVTERWELLGSNYSGAYTKD